MDGCATADVPELADFHRKSGFKFSLRICPSDLWSEGSSIHNLARKDPCLRVSIRIFEHVSNKLHRGVHNWCNRLMDRR